MYKIVISITALLLSIVILQFANSVIAPTIVLTANEAGVATSRVGLIPAIYGFGFVSGCFWARNLIRKIGHIRSFSFAAAMLTSLTVLLFISDNINALMIYRGLMGAAVAIVMTCIDSWVGYVTPGNIRGRVLGFYSTITKLAYFGAPALLAYSAVVSENALIFALLLFSLSLLPVCLTKLPQPKFGPAINTTFGSLLKDIPSGFVAVFILGFTNTAVLNLLPVYGVKVNFTASEALALLAAVHLGGLIFQWPVGYLSDLIGRRQVLVMIFSISTVASFTMMYTNPDVMAFTLFISFLWGGAALSAYSISLSHGIDRSSSEDSVNICASLLTVWSVGSIFGPFFGGLVMELFGSNALYVYCGVFHGGTAIFILGRILTTAKRNRLIREQTATEIAKAIWPNDRPL